MRKPFNNKSNYDPGRFNHTVLFISMEVVKAASGGTKPIDTVVFSTRAVKEQIRTGSQIEAFYGVSSLNHDAVFIIRAKSGQVAKNMRLQDREDLYEVCGIVPTDDPVNYTKIVCRFIERVAIFPVYDGYFVLVGKELRFVQDAFWQGKIDFNLIDKELIFAHDQTVPVDGEIVNDDFIIKFNDGYH